MADQRGAGGGDDWWARPSGLAGPGGTSGPDPWDASPGPWSGPPHATPRSYGSSGSYGSPESPTVVQPAPGWGGQPYGEDGPGGPYSADPYAPPARRRGRRVGGVLALCLLAGLVGGGAGGTAGYLAAQEERSSLLDSDAGLAPSTSRVPDRAPDSVAGVAARLLPSVVSIGVEGADGTGTGSGFVLRDDGYLLTNNHVVASVAAGGDITVSFQDGSSEPARIVGRDPNYDLAVIKVEARNLPVAALADSDDVVVGDPVIAIGSPLGLSGTVTTGIVSALDRPVTAGANAGTESAFINAIQTDAAINPGNSGGPLVDASGRVIGVNSAIATLSSGLGAGQNGSIGLGFAIPMNQAKRTAQQLIETGRATYPVIGARLDGTYAGAGARIREVTAGGPAESAGLRPDDVVTSFDGDPVAGSAELIVAIRARRPGERVTLTVRRDGGQREVSLVLGESE